MAAQQSNNSLPRVLRRRTARSAEGSAMAARPQLLRRAAARSSPSSTSRRWRRWRIRSACRCSAALSRQTSMCRGWPPWHEFDAARHDDRRRFRRGCASSSGSSAAPRPTSIPTPGFAIWRLRRRWMKAFGHMDCGVYAEVVGAGHDRGWRRGGGRHISQLCVSKRYFRISWRSSRFFPGVTNNLDQNKVVETSG